MDFSSDDAAFFSDFADSGLLAGTEVCGIYSDVDGLFSVGGGMRAAGPTYLLPATAVPAGAKGAVLELLSGRGAGEWTVRSAEADGTGHVRLSLTKGAAA